MKQGAEGICRAVTRAMAALTVAVALIGCGGGGDDCDPGQPNVPTPRVDCTAVPGGCK